MKSLIGSLFLLFIVSGLAFGGSGFRKVSSDNGINVYVKEDTGDKFVVIKGDTYLNYRIDRVLSVITEADRAHEWLPNVEKMVSVEQLSSWSRIQYSLVKSPWPVDDRIFIVKGMVRISKDKDEAWVIFHSVEDSRVDPKGRVVGELLNSAYRLERDPKNPNRTKMTVEIKADPKGWLPTFLVNFFQRQWPGNFFVGLNRQLLKSDIKTSKLFYRAMKK